MNPQTVIAQNCTWSTEYEEASFVAMLHENGIWQRDRYWPIEWALYELVKREEDCGELYGAVFRIFSYTMFLISSHIDRSDSFEIFNLGQDEIYEFRERIQIVFESFFCKKIPEQAMFEEKNPLIT